MFIGLCGSAYAGKMTIAQYLVKNHGFTRLILAPNQSSQPSQPPAEEEGGETGPENARIFAFADELLDFVTKRWRERWVVADIPSEPVLDMYARRPFFLLVSVDAPLQTRWRRFLADDKVDASVAAALWEDRRRRRGRGGSEMMALVPDGLPSSSSSSLEAFVAFSDAHLYDPVHGQLPLMSRASVRILNTSSDLSQLYATLDKLDLLNADRLRPSWDHYFMSLASLAAQRSNCMKRRVGCVVVRDRRVVSTGYNGTPRGLRNCGEGGCGRCNAGEGSGHGLATCLCLHAEENALLEAGRERLREGAVLYCDTCPCLTCSIKIVQVGISEVVYSQEYSMDNSTATVLREGGVRLRQFVPPPNGLIRPGKPEEFN